MCSPEAVQVAIKLRDLLNGSVRINPEEGVTAGIDGISMVPAVSYPLPLGFACRALLALSLLDLTRHMGSECLHGDCYAPNLVNILTE